MSEWKPLDNPQAIRRYIGAMARELAMLAVIQGDKGVAEALLAAADQAEGDVTVVKQKMN